MGGSGQVEGTEVEEECVNGEALLCEGRIQPLWRPSETCGANVRTAPKKVKETRHLSSVTSHRLTVTSWDVWSFTQEDPGKNDCL